MPVPTTSVQISTVNCSSSQKNAKSNGLVKFSTIRTNIIHLGSISYTFPMLHSFLGWCHYSLVCCRGQILFSRYGCLDFVVDFVGVPCLYLWGSSFWDVLEVSEPLWISCFSLMREIWMFEIWLEFIFLQTLVILGLGF